MIPTGVRFRMIDAIEAALVAEAAHRPGRTVDDWVAAERHAVAVEANRWASAHGGNTVTVDDVERVEPRAMGHSDYAHKLALYAAELVWGPAPCVVCGGTGRHQPASQPYRSSVPCPQGCQEENHA